MNDIKINADKWSVLVSIINYKLLGIIFDQTSKLKTFLTTDYAR